MGTNIGRDIGADIGTLGLLEPTFVTGRAACRGSLLDIGVFPDLEGAFPDPEKYFQTPKIAVIALDLH